VVEVKSGCLAGFVLLMGFVAGSVWWARIKILGSGWRRTYAFPCTPERMLSLNWVDAGVLGFHIGASP